MSRLTTLLHHKQYFLKVTLKRVKLHKSWKCMCVRTFCCHHVWCCISSCCSTQHVSTGPHQCDFATMKFIITFRVSRRRREMLSGLCVCLSLAAFPHYCTDPGATWGMVGVPPFVVHYWVDLQSVHGFRCYDNVAANARCQWVVVLALCLVILVITVGLLGYIIIWRCCLTNVSQLKSREKLIKHQNQKYRPS